MKNKIILFLVAGIVLSIVGCATGSGTKVKELVNLEVSSVLKFSDLPIPLGFSLLANESYAFQNNQLRIALIKYIGKAPAESVSKFYQDQMPLYNWALINIVEYANVVLNFQRENEVCTISVTPIGSKSQLVLSITPRTNATSASSKNLVK